jgi:hypothetical protein
LNCPRIYFRANSQTERPDFITFIITAQGLLTHYSVTVWNMGTYG